MPYGRTYTEKGRVVYDRKEHFFRWKDAWRIVRKLEAPSEVDIVFEKKAAEDFESLLKIWLTITVMLVDYFSTVWDIVSLFRGSVRLFRKGMIESGVLWQKLLLRLE